MTFTRKVDSLSFEVSVVEERVYDMSSPSGELCHAPPALLATLPAATLVPVTEVRVSESRDDIRRTYQTVVSEAANRIEGEMPTRLSRNASAVSDAP